MNHVINPSPTVTTKQAMPWLIDNGKVIKEIKCPHISIQRKNGLWECTFCLEKLQDKKLA